MAQMSQMIHLGFSVWVWWVSDQDQDSEALSQSFQKMYITFANSEHLGRTALQTKIEYALCIILKSSTLSQKILWLFWSKLPERLENI